MSRLQIYVVGSALLANVVLLRAYYERPNFYSAAVYISQSTGSLMFLINIVLIVTASFGYGLQRLFYGPLRSIETEQLYDKAWFAVSETLLAMTIFRDDIGIWFFAMFLCLLAGKVWQWIGEGRVELLEQQPPANPRLFHARLMSSLLLSVGFDVFMMNYCIDSILQETRPGVMVMFGFEYVLLTIASVSSLLRYMLSLVELVIIQRQEKARREARQVAREQAQQHTDTAETIEDEDEDDEDDEDDVPGWEEKGRWVFYLDLTTDFIKSVVYLGFFMILMAFYGIPIHIMRDLFMTVRSFIKRLNDFVRYRNATRDMNARYPDATEEELGRENTCIVCREEMRPWVQPGELQAGQRVDERQRAKKLPCGHILHFSCLRSWLERQQVCPTCRRPVLDETTTQNNQQNNQANPGQQNQPNAPPPGPAGGAGPFGRFLFPQNMNNVPPADGQQGQQGQGGQPGGQQDRPAGNMRVFNLGPIRIALGNLRIPQQQQQGNANNINNNNNVIADLARQLVHNQNPLQNPNHPQNIGVAPNQLLHGMPMPLPRAHHPADIQSDILRLQHNIIASLRQLNAQHDQLEYIHALLGELHRLQQASGITAATGQELPTIAPLNTPFGAASVDPQAYLSSGPVLRQGDAGLPEGLILPEGWTLRPMALAHPAANAGSQGMNSLQRAQSVAAGETSTPSTSSMAPNVPSRTDSSQARPASSGAPSAPSPTAASSSKQAEPSSLESSWTFSDVAEGSSSAVAGSSTGRQHITRRTATVEDAEDNGQ